jgi:hypothetical protein
MKTTKQRAADAALKGAVEGLLDEFSDYIVEVVNIEDLSRIVRISHPSQGPRSFQIKVSEPQEDK